MITKSITPEFIASINELVSTVGFNKASFVAGFNPSTFRSFYILTDDNGNIRKNKAGETITIEVSLCRDLGISEPWIKKGFIKHPMTYFWVIGTYVTTSDGATYRGYNPVIKGREINFDYIKEATTDVLIEILTEIIYRFENQIN